MKKKSTENIFAMNVFVSPAFTQRWNMYLERFGEDIAILFGDDYSTKLYFSAVLTEMYDGKFASAKNKIKDFFVHCKTQYETDILCRLIAVCESEANAVKNENKIEIENENENREDPK